MINLLKRIVMKSSKKWNRIYILVIVANIIFAAIFYLITAVYGNN
ncbi:hypothetical protein JCM19275_3646 [Nonlabens ulvanivorans]|uniref:Uncharacterized protein n=1 Tax=Nonlabens ulvanivorans TaxID=906888 RepID=A0A081DDX4_NONUL|nr:hypothetical protein JCM19296_2725 [Nonlabens ulvanivorans]GAK99848.1 hypothetical protein JCM19314_1033 [Nonlabens ulvanivorans]GAL77034.1 hypothetical protein JCM19275_3646 [Nonlabens ulvanivorans]